MECRGCGFCCRKAPCALAVISSDGSEIGYRYGSDPREENMAPCPFLVWAVDRSRCWCGLILQEVHTDPDGATITKRTMGIGAGCCSPCAGRTYEAPETRGELWNP